MPFATLNGIDLYYETHGSGPALVFAHGGGGSHLSWWQQRGSVRCAHVYSSMSLGSAGKSSYNTF